MNETLYPKTGTMHTIKELQGVVQQAMQAAKYPERPATLYEPFEYILNLGGKRLRPVLVLMGCELFGGDITKAVQPALGIELFHNFTLIHDDIMDEAPLRRGNTTIHEKFDTNVAILSGDVMLIYANRFVSQVDAAIMPAVMDIFNQTAIDVCEGQQYDMDFEKSLDVSIEDYIHMISLKTAALLAGSLHIGALIGGAGEEDASHLYTFGKELGIAFQLQDDILDTYGQKEAFGKQVGGDIIQNKKTFLLIKALSADNAHTRQELQEWIEAKNPDPSEKVAAVTTVYNHLGVREEAEAQMQQHYDAAMAALDAIEVPDDRKAVIRAFADQLMIREH